MSCSVGTWGLLCAVNGKDDIHTIVTFRNIDDIGEQGYGPVG